MKKSNYSVSCFLLTLLFSLALRPTQASDIVEVLPLTDRIIMVHFDDGYVNHHQRGQKRSDETVILDALITANAMQAGRYTLRSTDDAAYADGLRPLDVGRKSKGTDYAWFCDGWSASTGCLNNRPDHAKEHWVYLFLPTPMQPGKTYRLNTGTLAANGYNWTFTYDVNQLRSEAVHVNNVGYAPTAALKYGYVYHWLGDKGGLDLSGYAGKAFHLVNVATNAIAFSGTIAFRKSATNPETGQTSQQPNQNFSAADVYECDFSAFNTPGEYRLAVEGIGCSFPFTVAADAHFEPFYWTMKGIYQQRSGISLDAPFTDQPRPAPHNPTVTPDFAGRLKYTSTRYFDVTNSDATPADKPTWEAGIKGDLNTFGWYQDAGDWDGYFTHTNVPSMLLFLYELNPNRFTDGQLQIPESSNGLSDVLDEATWLLRFYKRTKDEIVAKGWGTGGIAGARVMGDLWGGDVREDGTTKASWDDTDRQWIVSGEDPWTTYRYAAMAAQLAYVLQKAGKTDPQGVNWQQEATNAYAWAQANTKPGDGVKFGFDLLVQRLYAAVSLYRLTGTATYHDQAKADFAAKGWNGSKNNLDDDELYPVWLYLTLPTNRPTDAGTLANVRAASDATANLYLVSFTDQRAARWGGNYWLPMLIGQPTTPLTSQGVFSYLDNRTRNPQQADKYLKYMYTTADYFLGTNPLNMTWITGLGERSPVGIFHMDSWYSGQPTPRRGIVPYGPWLADKSTNVTGPWSNRWPEKTLYPANPDAWPGHERWFDQRSSPLSCEFTIHQNSVKSAFMYGFLYAASTLPFPPKDEGIVTPTTLTYEYWSNKSGTQLSAIDWSTPPTGTKAITSLEGPVNWADLYGARIRGYVVPATTGDYTFYFSSDDYGDLSLSTDADPANKTKIASVNGWTSSRLWTKYASQKSVPVALVAGQKYYVEARMKESGGGDNIAVGWTGPGISAITVIGGANVLPYQASSARLAATEAESDANPVMSVFPNPARQELTVQFRAATPQRAQLQMFNQAGRAVLTESVTAQAGSNRVHLSLPTLPPGMYLITVEQSTGKTTRKVVIE